MRLWLLAVSLESLPSSCIRLLNPSWLFSTRFPKRLAKPNDKEIFLHSGFRTRAESWRAEPEIYRQGLTDHSIFIFRDIYICYLGKVDIANDLDNDCRFRTDDSLVRSNHIVIRFSCLNLKKDGVCCRPVDDFNLTCTLALLLAVLEDDCLRGIDCHKLCPVLLLLLHFNF